MTVFKDAANLADPNPVEATHIESYLLGNYPADAIQWVKHASWIGPVQVPQDRVDYDDAESWTASRQPGTVAKFARRIKNGTGHTKPVIMVQVPGSYKAKVVDGHHRSLAYKLLGRPVKAYVGTVSKGDDRWESTHSSQVHSGADPHNKQRKAAVKAKADSGYNPEAIAITMMELGMKVPKPLRKYVDAHVKKQLRKSARVAKSKPAGPVLVKSSSVPLADRDITTRDGVLEKDLVNAIRAPIEMLIAQVNSPQGQSADPCKPGYIPSAGGVSKAHTYSSHNPFANSDDPAEREWGGRLANKSAEDQAAERYARGFWAKSMSISDNPADREAVSRMQNPARESPLRHVMVSQDQVLRDAGTGEPVQLGSKLPDPSPDLFGSDGMTGRADWQSIFGGYDGGYARN